MQFPLKSVGIFAWTRTTGFSTQDFIAIIYFSGKFNSKCNGKQRGNKFG